MRTVFFRPLQLVSCVCIITLAAGPLWAASQKAQPKALIKPATVAAGTPAPVSATLPAPEVTAPLTQSGRILWLDKQTNKRTPVIVLANAPQVLGGLQISLAKCVPDYAGTPGQDLGWLDVKETEARQTPWFSGWMFSTAPDVATLDHPRYDLTFQGCGTAPRRIGNTAPAPANAGPDIPPADSEAPSADSEQPQSGGAPATEGETSSSKPKAPAAAENPDAYVVQGVEKDTPKSTQPPTTGADNDAMHKMMEGGVY